MTVITRTRFAAAAFLVDVAACTVFLAGLGRLRVTVGNSTSPSEDVGEVKDDTPEVASAPVKVAESLLFVFDRVRGGIAKYIDLCVQRLQA